MRGSLDTPPSPPRASFSSAAAGGTDGGGRTALVSTFTDTLKRARTWRPVTLVASAITRLSPGDAAAATAAADTAGAASGADEGSGSGADGGGGSGGGAGGGLLDLRRRRGRDEPRSRRALSLVPRPSPSLGAHGAEGDGGGSSGRHWLPGGNPGHSRRGSHAVPVAKTRVQDGVKWVNLVHLANLARVFTPCLRPRNRRRVRFGPSPTQRGLMGMSSGGGGGGAEGGKLSGDLAAAAGGGGPGPPTAGAGAAAAARPVYIQVRLARQLVWPSFEGVEHSCRCVLLVGGEQPAGATQSVPVATGGGGGGAGAAAWSGGSSNNTVTWNEVFSLPRSCFEGALSSRVVFEVWSCESFGDDVLVGQADLDLSNMLDSLRPHPVAKQLELRALDEETGQLEPGSCGELHVAAWVEPEVAKAPPQPYALPSSAPADLEEAGVVTSNLSAPRGTAKSAPQVVHSTLGTLYEEPCVVALKISVVGLEKLSYELLVSGAAQGGITKRRVRLEGHRSATSSLRDPRDGRERERRKDGAASGTPTVSLGGASSGTAIPFASPSITRGLGPYLERVKRRRQQQKLLHQLQHPRAGGGSGGGAAVDGGFSGSVGAAAAAAAAAGGGGGSVAAAAAAGALGGFWSRLARQSGLGRLVVGGLSGGAAAAASGSMDELIEEDEDTPLAGASGGGVGGGGAATPVDDKTFSGDDGDDGSSLTLNPTLPLSGMAAEEQAVGAVQGQGVFCYFKVSVDRQSEKSRLRWLPAPSPPPPGLPPPQQLQHLLDTAASPVALQPSVFVFPMARPLSNVPVGLAMYVTTSARRKGRVVGRFTIPLYDILDHVLGAAAARGGVPAAQRPDLGVSGKKVELVQGFEEEELGSVRLVVQLADLDERASLFRLPLVTDPHQLLAEGALDATAGCAPSLMAAAMRFSGAGASAAGGGGGGVGGVGSWRGDARRLGPVLSDTELLRKALNRHGAAWSAVEPDVESWFLGSYARAGSLKLSGDLALQARIDGLRASGISGSGPTAAAAPGAGLLGRLGGTGLLSRDAARSGRLDPVRLFNEALAAADGSLTGDDGAAAAAAGTVLSNLFKNPDGLSSSFTECPSPGGFLAGASAGRGGAGAPEAAAAAGTCSGRVLGSLALRIASMNPSGALTGSNSCCIVKCGPHWLRTVDWGSSGHDGGGMPQWQVIIPIYSPATVLTVGIFTNSAKSVMGLTFSDNLSLVSRVRLKLSCIRPYRRSWHIVAMYLNGAPAAAPGAAPLVAVLGLKLQYDSLGALMASYMMASAPESLYELDLDADAALKMETDARKISENWLASAQPPIPPEVARLLLDDGRTTFKFARTKNNWRRVKAGLRLVLGLNSWFRHICSWESHRDSWEVVACIALLCYLPSTACQLFFFMIALRGFKGLLNFRRRVAALVEGGVEQAAAWLISPRAVAPGAEVGAAAATAANLAAAAAACGAASAAAAVREPLGTVIDVTIGGGVAATGSDDEAGEDSKVPVGTVAEFRRKFAELIELGLLLQNLFDDVASILERLQAVLSFADVVASTLFIAACFLLVGVMALLGFPTTAFLVLLWQVRPPSLRDALPPPPFSYFMKLPCKSAAEFG